ncbi:MAG: hypothetical protein WD934_10670 [Gemmatimonadales bacterium]
MTDTVVVATFRTRAEAELAALSLQGAEIPYLIQSAEGMMHGPLGPGAQIRVLSAAAPAARELLGELAADAPEAATRRLVALGTWREADLDPIVARLDGVDIPYVIEHAGDATGPCTVFVRREHQLPAGRALRHGA